MNCPKCGMPVKRHIEARLFDCELTEAQALIAAQRHAAAKDLVDLHDKYFEALKDNDDGYSAEYYGGAIFAYQIGIRNLGIQRKLRSER